MWQVIPVRWQATLLLVGYVSACVLLFALPFELMLVAGVWALALGGLSYFVHCPKCRTWAFRRQVRLFGESWVFGWLWPPRRCSVCGQDFRDSSGAHVDQRLQLDRKEPERRSPRQVFIALRLCAVTSGASALMAVALGEWLFLAFAVVVTVGWLAAAAVWRKTHPWG